MFRNDAQKNQVISVLLGSVHRPELWTESGPTQDACVLLATGGGYLSHGQAVMLRVCFDVWNGDGQAKFGEVVGVLDPSKLFAVGMLLVALAQTDFGHVAGTCDRHRSIDQWVIQARAGEYDER